MGGVQLDQQARQNLVQVRGISPSLGEELVEQFHQFGVYSWPQHRHLGIQPLRSHPLARQVPVEQGPKLTPASLNVRTVVVPYSREQEQNVSRADLRAPAAPQEKFPVSANQVNEAVARQPAARRPMERRGRLCELGMDIHAFPHAQHMQTP